LPRSIDLAIFKLSPKRLHIPTRPIYLFISAIGRVGFEAGD